MDYLTKPFISHTVHIVLENRIRGNIVAGSTWPNSIPGANLVDRRFVPRRSTERGVMPHVPTGGGRHG